MTVKFGGTDTDLIIKKAQRLIDDKEAYEYMSKISNPYGDGHTCEKVVQYIKGIKS